MVHPVLVGRRYVKSLFKNGNVTGLVAIWRLNLPLVFAVMWARCVWRLGSTAAKSLSQKNKQISFTPRRAKVKRPEA
jgi:hypothetical protein